MKIKQLVNLLAAITWIALAPWTRADARGGGGGGGDGGHFSGGGAHFSGTARTSPFRGTAPHFAGRSEGLPMPMRAPWFTGTDRRTMNRPSASNIAPDRSTFGITRNGNATPQATQSLRAFSQRGLNGRTDHIVARHDENWHRDWDHRHAHFHNRHFFVFEDGFWFGLDDGFFPWDYLPYYASDYYPYDYYTDPQAAENNSAAYYNGSQADPTVESAQTELIQLGYYGGPVDGIYGPSTRDAIARYQIANQLDVTGSLSPDTLESLQLPEGTQS